MAMALHKQATPQEVKEILSAGASKKPQELLQTYGYDITSTAFWDEGFAQLQILVDRLRSLT
jgi:oligoendopeptidase F